MRAGVPGFRSRFSGEKTEGAEGPRPRHGRRPRGLAHLRRPDEVIQVCQLQRPAEGRRHGCRTAAGLGAPKSPNGARRHALSATLPESAPRGACASAHPQGVRPLLADPSPRRSLWSSPPPGHGRSGQVDKSDVSPAQGSPAGQVLGACRGSGLALLGPTGPQDPRRVPGTHGHPNCAAE